MSKIIKYSFYKKTYFWPRILTEHVPYKWLHNSAVGSLHILFNIYSTSVGIDHVPVVW